MIAHILILLLFCPHSPNHYSQSVDQYLWLTLNVYHEARSEDSMGRKAVAHVTLNRAENYNKPIKRIVLQPYQFSWTHQLDSYIPKDIESFMSCAIDAIYATLEHDFTKGATHYHRYDINPYWTKEMVPLGKYGAHKFYIEKNK